MQCGCVVKCLHKREGCIGLCVCISTIVGREMRMCDRGQRGRTGVSVRPVVYEKTYTAQYTVK